MKGLLNTDTIVTIIICVGFGLLAVNGLGPIGLIIVALIAAKVGFKVTKGKK